MNVEIEGSLHIALHRQAGKIHEVEIHSSRTLTAVRIFQGKPVYEMLKMLPMLYHVCGIAQASASVAACEQVMYIKPGKACQLAREMLVCMETAREHMWRIMMDWADNLAEEKHKAGMIQVHQILPGLKKALFADGDGFSPNAKVNVDTDAVKSCIQGLKKLIEKNVFAMPLEAWLDFADWNDLQRWLQSTDTIATRMLQKVSGYEKENHCQTGIPFLPVLDEPSLHERLRQSDADVFITHPVWQGEPCETSVLSRQQHQPLIAWMLNSKGDGIATRTLARLVELAAIPCRLELMFNDLLSNRQEQFNKISGKINGVGLGQVEAARGRLVHRLELENGIVQRYQIVAPTEWNFHPQGVAARLLKTLAAEDEVKLLQQADLLINAIDPCVRYDMAVH